MALLLHLRSPDGETTAIEVPMDATVGDLRKAVCSCLQMTRAGLAYQGRAFTEDKEFLADVGVSQEATVEVTVRGLPPSPPTPGQQPGMDALTDFQSFKNKEEENKWWEAHCKALGHNEWHYGKSYGKTGEVLLKCYLCRRPHRKGTGPHRNGSQPPQEFDWHSQKRVPKEQMPEEWRTNEERRRTREGYDKVICLPVEEVQYVFEEGYDTVICLPAAKGYVFHRPKASAGYTQSCTASDDAVSCRSRALRSLLDA